MKAIFVPLLLAFAAATAASTSGTEDAVDQFNRSNFGNIGLASENTDALFKFSGGKSVSINHSCSTLWQATDELVWIEREDNSVIPNRSIDHSTLNLLRFPSRLTTVGCDGAGYGCWFFVTNGIGARVRVNKIKQFEFKSDAYKWIHSKTSWWRIQYATLRCSMDAQCRTHSDMGLCLNARKEGYDGVMIHHNEKIPSNRTAPELVLCTDDCNRKVQCDECPDVAYALDCHCDPSYGISNCHREWNASQRPIPLSTCHLDRAEAERKRQKRRKLERRTALFGVLASPILLTVGAVAMWLQRTLKRVVPLELVKLQHSDL